MQHLAHNHHNILPGQETCIDARAAYYYYLNFKIPSEPTGNNPLVQLVAPALMAELGLDPDLPGLIPPHTVILPW